MFCAIQDVEQFLQIEIGAGGIPSATRAIVEATAAIQNYCQQVLALVKGETITLDCEGGRRIFLPELPVVAVGPVVEDGKLLVKGEDYKLGQYGVLHRMGVMWAAGIQVIRVTYSHGYAELPADIVAIATRAAARAYQAGLRAAETDGVAGIASKSLGDYSVTFGSEQSVGAGEAVLGASAAPMLLRSEKDALSRYRYRSA